MCISGGVREKTGILLSGLGESSVFGITGLFVARDIDPGRAF